MSLNNFLRPSLQRQPAMFVYEQKTLAHALPGMKAKGNHAGCLQMKLQCFRCWKVNIN